MLVHVQTALGQGDHALLVVDPDHDGLHLVAHLHQILHLGGGVVGELGDGNVAGVLGTQIHLDLGRRDGHNSTSYLIPIIQSFDRLLQHVSKGLLDLHDFIAHFVTNLLYYPRGCGSTRSDADNFCLGQPAPIQLLRPFNLLHAGTYLPADLSQTLGIGAFPVADDHHVVAYRGQLMGFLLAF